MSSERLAAVAVAAGAAAAFVATFAGVDAAFAHGVLSPGTSAWSAWALTPEIVAGSLIAALLYGVGLHRRQERERGRGWRHLAFYAGLAAIFLALQSPIDAIAERVFVIHQIQHLLLRMIGPMLLMLSAPQGLLVAGMPKAAQRRLLAPILASGAVRGVFGFLARPVVATVLFVAMLYVWQIPRLHDLALRDDGLHYLMHASLLFTGLVFFWRVFDPRPAPQGTRYGIRLMMLWMTILANIVIGASLVFKSDVLYPAYGDLGRLWEMSALVDERLGAATIWIPGSMMSLIAILIVIHMWGRHETRVEARAETRERAVAPPLTAADVIRDRAGRNRTMALGFAAFAAAVFAAAIMVGVVRFLMGA